MTICAGWMKPRRFIVSAMALSAEQYQREIDPDRDSTLIVVSWRQLMGRLAPNVILLRPHLYSQEMWIALARCGAIVDKIEP